MLIQRTFARRVWSAISPDIAQEINNIHDIQHWIKSWENRSSRINFEVKGNINLVVITMLFIWKSRCELVFENKRCSINNMKTRILQFCMDNKIQTNINLNQLQVLCHSNISTRRTTSNTNYWNPPHRGMLKINIDASVLPNNHFAGIALIIRDFTGQLVEAWTMV